MLATATDYRLGWILREGDTIQTADATYTITGEPIGLGGSSVLYPASKSGSHLEYAIKECFPAKPAVYQRTRGIVRTADPNDELNQSKLTEFRKMISREKELGQEIRNTTMRAVSVWDELIPVSITIGGEDFREVSNGGFSVLERMDKKGRFFNELLGDIREVCPPEDRRTTFGLPSIQLTVQIMEQALRALKQVHDAGYYFGDMSGSNLLLTECDLEKNHVGIGHLIDFGSTRKLEADGYTSPIINEPVFSTDGFRPFEIRDHKDGELRLGKQADIYSAGCLFLRCVLSEHKIKTLGDSPSAGSNILTEVNGKAIGCSGSALLLVNEILDKATQYVPKDRYADASEMLDAILELKKYTEPPKFLLPSNLSSPDYWVPRSRDTELSAIVKSLNEGETVFLHGVGGIGKTECAIQLAKRLNPPRGAYLVHFQNSMKDTILRMNFSGYKYVPKQKGLSLEDLAESEYRERLDILREHYRDTVLIVDNFDVDNKTLDELRREPAFKDFLGLDLNRIFTTRYPVGRKEWEIRELSETALLDMMRYYCSDSSITDEQYLAILKEIQNHTLTTMLIARTLEESWGDITPEMILDALRNSRLAQEDYPEVVSDQNRSYQQKQIYEHLKALFDLSGMSEDALIALHCISLLPEDGIDYHILKDALHAEGKNELRNLLKRGWIKRSAQSKITVHPVISEVCLGEIPYNLQTQDFLIHLQNRFQANNCNYRERLQIARCFAKTADVLDVSHIVFAPQAAFMFLELGLYSSALHYSQNALTTLKSIATYDEQTYYKLAQIYNQLAAACCGLKNINSALDNGLKAVDIAEQHLPAHRELLANFYNNLALYYGYSGNLRSKLNYVKKGIDIWESIHKPDSLALAKGYNNLGTTYSETGNYQLGEYYLRKAIQIYEKQNQYNNPDLALSYNNLARTYSLQNNSESAEKFFAKAETVINTENNLGHPLYAMILSSIGTFYLSIADSTHKESMYERALDYFKKAERFAHYQADPDFVLIGQIYSNIAYCNNKIGNSSEKANDLCNLLWTGEFANRQRIQFLKDYHG